MAFELPPLPYAEDALEPHIDARTMSIHHDKHHAGYTNNLNNAIQGTEWEGKSVGWRRRRAPKGGCALGTGCATGSSQRGRIS